MWNSTTERAPWSPSKRLKKRPVSKARASGPKTGAQAHRCYADEHPNKNAVGAMMRDKWNSFIHLIVQLSMHEFLYLRSCLSLPYEFNGRLSAGVLPTPTARAWQAARGLGPHAQDAQGSRMSEQAAVHALPGHGGSTSGRLGRIGAGTGDPDHVINVPMHRWVTSSRRGMTKNPCLHP